MLGMKWRTGAMASLLAVVALTGCGLGSGGGGTQSTTPRTVSEEERNQLLQPVYEADVEAVRAREALVAVCRNLIGYEELMHSKKCNAPGERTALFNAGQKCQTVLDKYNQNRGNAQRIEKGDTVKFTLKVDNGF